MGDTLYEALDALRRIAALPRYNAGIEYGGEQDENVYADEDPNGEWIYADSVKDILRDVKHLLGE